MISCFTGILSLSLYQQRDKEVTQLLLSLYQKPKVTIINKQITAMVQTMTTEERIEELIKSYEWDIRNGIKGIEGLPRPRYWGVRLTPGRLQIGLIDAYESIDRNCIEIYFGYDYPGMKSVWEANIGTRGAFALAEGSERLNFYIGAGLILSSDLVQHKLKKSLRDDFMGSYRRILENR